MSIQRQRKASLIFLLLSISIFGAAAKNDSAPPDIEINPLPDNQPALSQVQSPVKEADLKSRSFSVGLAALNAKVREQTGQTNFFAGFKELLSAQGVDFSPPKTLFISEGLGLIFVHATGKDLDNIESILTQLDCPVPEVHLKAQFIEVPKSFFADERDSVPAGVTNGRDLLTAQEAKGFLKQLESFKEASDLAESEATTLAGREMEMRALKTGQILNVLPMALKDGYSIRLNTDDESVTLYDGQTLALFPQPKQSLSMPLDKKDGNKILVILLTASLMDDTGNRIHTDGEMPFAQSGFPPPWP